MALHTGTSSRFLIAPKRGSNYCLRRVGIDRMLFLIAPKRGSNLMVRPLGAGGGLFLIAPKRGSNSLKVHFGDHMGQVPHRP